MELDKTMSGIYAPDVHAFFLYFGSSPIFCKFLLYLGGNNRWVPLYPAKAKFYEIFAPKSINDLI